MGGHGGLNILPQKRWNVYNFENRERVRRDEEAAAREEQVRQQKARQAELEFKLGHLREIAQSKRRRVEEGGAERGALEEGSSEGAIVVRAEASGSIEGGRGDGSDGAERPQHINLFAEFEAKALEEGHGRTQDREKGRKGAGRDRDREGSRKERNSGKGVEKVDGKPTGEPADENYSLGHGVVDKNGKKPWYLYKSFMIDRTRDGQQGADAKLQRTGEVEKRTVKSGKRKTVEELRAERIRREQQEKNKVRQLVVAKAGTSSIGYDPQLNGRAPRYHGSFGNAR